MARSLTFRKGEVVFERWGRGAAVAARPSLVVDVFDDGSIDGTVLTESGGLFDGLTGLLEVAERAVGIEPNGERSEA